MKTIAAKIPGIFITFLIAVPAWLAGQRIPVVGAPILGIVFGMCLAGLKRLGMLEEGIKFTSQRILQYSIILLGFGMNLFQVFHTGKETLLLLCFTLTTTFLTAYLAGRLLKLDRNTNILIGVGSAICGGSAIAATAPVIGAREEEIAQSISTIFFFNVIAAFLFPAIGHLFGMNDHLFGLWAGTAINDTSSVVAAGYTYSESAGNLAVVVKLTRTLMIIPVTIVLALLQSGQQGKGAVGRRVFSVFPWFVIGFLLASVAVTFFPLPEALCEGLTKGGKFFVAMAMAGIGLNTNIGKLLKNGSRSILLGLICWLSLAIVSLGVQYLLLTL